MDIAKELYNIQTTAEGLQKEEKDSQQANAILQSFSDKEKGLNGSKVAEAVQKYLSGDKSLSDEEVDLIGSIRPALSGYYQKVLESLKGMSYEKAKKMVQRFAKILPFLDKNIDQILKYISKLNPEQIPGILKSYKENKDKALELYKAKQIAFGPYMKK